MEFIEIAFYDYKIRMCIDNGIRMYLVSDLLRQYNEKHNTNKRFADYLQNKQTQELLQHMSKSVHGNSHVRSEGGQDGQSSEMIDICDVIQYITTSSFDGANKGYIVCEELLHACLMWVDPAFACAVLRFLKRLRQQDNDYLRKTNEELNQENKELKNRFVPAEIPDTDTTSEWYFFLTYYPNNDSCDFVPPTIILKSEPISVRKIDGITCNDKSQRTKDACSTVSRTFRMVGHSNDG